MRNHYMPLHPGSPRRREAEGQDLDGLPEPVAVYTPFQVSAIVRAFLTDDERSEIFGKPQPTSEDIRAWSSMESPPDKRRVDLLTSAVAKSDRAYLVGEGGEKSIVILLSEKDPEWRDKIRQNAGFPNLIPDEEDLTPQPQPRTRAAPTAIPPEEAISMLSGTYPSIPQIPAEALREHHLKVSGQQNPTEGRKDIDVYMEVEGALSREYGGIEKVPEEVLLGHRIVREKIGRKGFSVRRIPSDKIEAELLTRFGSRRAIPDETLIRLGLKRTVFGHGLARLEGEELVEALDRHYDGMNRVPEAVLLEHNIELTLVPGRMHVHRERGEPVEDVPVEGDGVVAPATVTAAPSQPTPSPPTTVVGAAATRRQAEEGAAHLQDRRNKAYVEDLLRANNLAFAGRGFLPSYSGDALVGMIAGQGDIGYAKDMVEFYSPHLRDARGHVSQEDRWVFDWMTALLLISPAGRAGALSQTTGLGAKPISDWVKRAEIEPKIIRALPEAVRQIVDINKWFKAADAPSPVRDDTSAPGAGPVGGETASEPSIAARVMMGEFGLSQDSPMLILAGSVEGLRAADRHSAQIRGILEVASNSRRVEQRIAAALLPREEWDKLGLTEAARDDMEAGLSLVSVSECKAVLELFSRRGGIRWFLLTGSAGDYFNTASEGVTVGATRVAGLRERVGCSAPEMVDDVSLIEDADIVVAAAVSTVRELDSALAQATSKPAKEAIEVISKIELGPHTTARPNKEKFLQQYGRLSSEFEAACMHIVGEELFSAITSGQDRTALVLAKILSEASTTGQMPEGVAEPPVIEDIPSPPPPAPPAVPPHVRGSDDGGRRREQPHGERGGRPDDSRSHGVRDVSGRGSTIRDLAHHDRDDKGSRGAGKPPETAKPKPPRPVPKPMQPAAPKADVVDALAEAKTEEDVMGELVREGYGEFLGAGRTRGLARMAMEGRLLPMEIRQLAVDAIGGKKEIPEVREKAPPKDDTAPPQAAVSPPTAALPQPMDVLAQASKPGSWAEVMGDVTDGSSTTPMTIMKAHQVPLMTFGRRLLGLKDENPQVVREAAILAAEVTETSKLGDDGRILLMEATEERLRGWQSRETISASDIPRLARESILVGHVPELGDYAERYRQLEGKIPDDLVDSYVEAQQKLERMF